MHLGNIQDWLEATDSDNNNNEGLAARPVTGNDAHDRAVKRRRLNPITPSCSGPNEDGNMASPTKRPYDDETPWAKRFQTGLRLERSYPSLSSASKQTTSSRRSASPEKQLRALELNPRGLDVRHLYDTTYVKAQPQTMRTLLRDIEVFTDGEGIVARDAQDALVKAADADYRFAWALRAGAAHVSDDKDLLSRTPLPSAVRRVMKAAFECNRLWHPGANWNLEVHQRIFHIAFRPTEETDFDNVVNFMGCATASIMREYSTTALAKKVDFCVYIEPKNDPLISPAFQTATSFVRSVMPEEVLGFTDFAPFDDRFFALSIKTKEPGENFKAAELELSVWEMARWAFLRRLAELRSGPPDTTGADANDDRPDVKLPEFLPGIIVQGHDWNLVITTMEKGKTVLWQKVNIGSSSTPRGIYQIVRTLQYLEKWVKDVHWPWLREMIEGIAEVYA